MSKPSQPHAQRLAAAFATLSVIALTPVAWAQGAYEQNTASYRCTVLGDSKSCAQAMPFTAVRIEDRIEPGPLARHLMFLGVEQDSAIEQARHGGESPTRRVVRITRKQFSSEQLYQRSIGAGDLRAETIETLYSAPINTGNLAGLSNLPAGASNSP